MAHSIHTISCNYCQGRPTTTIFINHILKLIGFPGGSVILGQEDYLEKGMAPHYSILAWRIPWTDEPGGLQPLGV